MRRYEAEDEPNGTGAGYYSSNYYNGVIQNPRAYMIVEGADIGGSFVPVNGMVWLNENMWDTFMSSGEIAGALAHEEMHFLGAFDGATTTEIQRRCGR
jgi:hypothetical protein